MKTIRSDYHCAKQIFSKLLPGMRIFASKEELCQNCKTLSGPSSAILPFRYHN